MDSSTKRHKHTNAKQTNKQTYPHIPTHTHTYTHAHTHIHTRAHTHPHTHTPAHTRTHTHPHARTQLQSPPTQPRTTNKQSPRGAASSPAPKQKSDFHACVCARARARACVYVCMCVTVFITCPTPWGDINSRGRKISKGESSFALLHFAFTKSQVHLPLTNHKSTQFQITFAHLPPSHRCFFVVIGRCLDPTNCVLLSS